MRKRAHQYTVDQNNRSQCLLFRQRRSRQQAILAQQQTQTQTQSNFGVGPIKYATKNIIQIDASNLGCKQYENVEIYPAINNTYILVCHFADQQHGVLHVGQIKKKREAQNETQNIIQNNMLSKPKIRDYTHQVLKQYKLHYQFDVNMLSAHEVLLSEKVRGKQLNYKRRLTIWNLNDYTIQKYTYSTDQQVLQTFVEVFSESQIMCICEVSKQKPGHMQQIRVNYYQAQPGKQLGLVSSHKFTRAFSYNWKPYKINKRQGLIFVNQVKDKQYEDNNYEYTICNTKSCTTMGILPFSSMDKYVYFPLTIVEIREGILFMRFKIQLKMKRGSQLYQSKLEQQQREIYQNLCIAQFNREQLPNQSFYWNGNQFICIYDILCNYQTGKIQKHNILNTSENIQFSNFIKSPQQANLYDKDWKKFNATIVDPISFRIIGKMVEHEQYQHFWTSDYDDFNYFQYRGGMEKDKEYRTIKFYTKSTHLSVYKLSRPKILMAQILSQLLPQIDEDLLIQTTKILTYQDREEDLHL